MKIKFYGTRGSLPVCEQDYLEFGGNTTSIKITLSSGRIAIIDAGSGIRNLGRDLIKEGFYQDQLFIGFTHFHWDHIQGFPFFATAYNPNMVINILAMGKDRNIENLEGIFREQMKTEYFPVPMEDMGATFNFYKLKKMN
jgi:phosphoribosyl 1,2-cyclic phosphodiesterase